MEHKGMSLECVLDELTGHVLETFNGCFHENGYPKRTLNAVELTTAALHLERLQSAVKELPLPGEPDRGDVTWRISELERVVKKSPVREVTTGSVFPSMGQASKAFGIPTKTIGNACARNRQKIADGKKVTPSHLRVRKGKANKVFGKCFVFECDYQNFKAQLEHLEGITPPPTLAELMPTVMTMHTDGCSMKKIGDFAGVDRITVHNWIIQHSEVTA